MGLEAERIVLFREGAGYDGLRSHNALVGERIRVAGQRPVAQVSIFQFDAVLVGLAVAGNFGSQAFPFDALVGQGARVAVIASVTVGREFASSRLAAHVVCAHVAVITFDRLSDTDSPLAVVSYGAGIRVVTGARFEGHVVTSCAPLALVLGAVVAVIAQVDKDAFFQVGLVSFAVAVVVQPVAFLLRGSWSVTVCQTFLLADPFPFTDSEFILCRAWSPQAQERRGFAARADPRVVNALVQLNAVNRGNILAREACRAGSLLSARSSAEAALDTIVDAGILCAAGADAAIACGAGPAQVGVVGNADVDYVGKAGRHLPAAPSGRTFLLAYLRADGLSRVLDAPAGLAVAVVIAFVQETALSCFTGREGGIRSRQVGSVGKNDVRPVALFQPVARAIGPGNVRHCLDSIRGSAPVKKRIAPQVGFMVRRGPRARSTSKTKRKDPNPSFHSSPLQKTFMTLTFLHIRLRLTSALCYDGRYRRAVNRRRPGAEWYSTPRGSARYA